MRMRRYCAIVDAFSTGSELSGLIAQYGYRCIHIQSISQLIDIYRSSFRPQDFECNIVHYGDVGRTLESIAGFTLDFILAGAESGVELADTLNACLDLPGNVPALSHARRNKHLMGEALRASNLLAADSFCTDSRSRALEWAEGHRQWPIVLKPTRSAGSDDVFFCGDTTTVGQAFDRIYGKRNRLNEENMEVLCQECLSGQEFIVDSVSWDGSHFLGEVWSVYKRVVPSGNVLYDLEVLEHPESENVADIRKYADRVLTALGIRFGPAHSELCRTSKGPTLIETGARMHGGISCSAVKEGIGYNHPLLTVECFCDRDRFGRRLEEGPSPIRKHIYVVTLISRQRGILAGYGRFNEVRKLSSYHSELALVSTGAHIVETIDLFTSPGIVYLVHEDRSTLDADYRRIRALEEDGMFELC